MSWSKCIPWRVGALIFLWLVVFLPVYIVVIKEPKDPTFTLERASVTGFNLTKDGRLTAFFDVTLRALNPNRKFNIKYKDIRVSIYKDKQELATDALPGFTQHKGNVTFLMAEPVALNVYIKNGPAAFDLQVESRMGYVVFDVVMTASWNEDEVVVGCPPTIVNLTTPVVTAARDVAPSSNDDDGEQFKRVKCHVDVYSDY